jgi:hypothetical protein
VFPAYFPVTHPERLAAAPIAVSSVAAPSPAPRRSLPQHAPRIDPGNWPVIAERARYKSLRDLACAYGVSHETIRAIVRRVDAVLSTTVTTATD